MAAARSYTWRSKAHGVLQGTRRGSKKSRGTAGEQNRDQLAGTSLEIPPSSSCPPARGDSPRSPAARQSHSKQRDSNGRVGEEAAPGAMAALDHAHQKGGSVAAGMFSEQSHVYPGNYHSCYWRALVKLLKGSGRKRLRVIGICSTAAVTEQGNPPGEENRGCLNPKEPYLPSN